MSIEINKTEQYTLLKTNSKVFGDAEAAEVEKAIAKLYASEGRINFILDLLGVNSLSENGLKLFSKVQKICTNEGGLWVLVSDSNDLMDEVSTKAEEFVLMLHTVDEAIDAVYMNELENEFKDEHEDEFGFEGESDY